MKGDGNVIWIAIGLILAIIILVLILSPLLSGQKTVSGTLSEANLKACCSNYLASQKIAANTVCNVADKQIPLQTLCSQVRGTTDCDPCGG